MNLTSGGCPSVSDIELLNVRGPWTSKSGGKLSVLFSFSTEALDRFLAHESEEFNRIPADIRGLRIYTIDAIPRNAFGGQEFHRARNEIVFAIRGSALWKCEDLRGGKWERVLTGSCGIRMPPFILHTYVAFEEDTSLLVVANTLFDPNDPATHDTYHLDAFRELQAELSRT